MWFNMKYPPNYFQGILQLRYCNVEVLDSKPRRVFDMAAKRALLKWKYKPQIEGGKPVVKRGEKDQLDFKLE